MQRFPDVNLKDLPYAKFILEQVKKEAQNWSSFWVCDLVRQVSSGNKVLDQEGAKFIDRIQKALAPYALVTHWLYEKGEAISSEPDKKDAYRREWIDHMLKELENDTHNS